MVIFRKISLINDTPPLSPLGTFRNPNVTVVHHSSLTQPFHISEKLEQKVVHLCATNKVTSIWSPATWPCVMWDYVDINPILSQVPAFEVSIQTNEALPAWGKR